MSFCSWFKLRHQSADSSRRRKHQVYFFYLLLYATLQLLSEFGSDCNILHILIKTEYFLQIPREETK